MKKLITYTLVGLFCLSTTTGFSQTQKETPQEKILRLEVENKVLQQKNHKLTQQIMKLKTLLQSRNTATQPGASWATPWPQQAPTPSSQGSKKASLPTLKPYYLTLEVQKKCEKYPRCRQAVERNYQQDPFYQVVSIQFQTYTWKKLSFSGVRDTTETRLFVTCRTVTTHYGCHFNMVIARDGKPI